MNRSSRREEALISFPQRWPPNPDAESGASSSRLLPTWMGLGWSLALPSFAGRNGALADLAPRFFEGQFGEREVRPVRGAVGQIVRVYFLPHCFGLG